MKIKNECWELIDLVGIVSRSKELFKLTEINPENTQIVLPYCCRAICFEYGNLKFLMNYNIEKRFFALVSLQKYHDGKPRISLISNDRNFMNRGESKIKSIEDVHLGEILKEYLYEKILENFEVEYDNRCH